MNMFNINKNDDLPKELIKSLNYKNGRGFSNATKVLCELFNHKKQLNYDEMIVGLYRHSGIIKSRQWLASTLHNLKKKNLVRCLNSGIYEKV